MSIITTLIRLKPKVDSLYNGQRTIQFLRTRLPASDTADSFRHYQKWKTVAGSLGALVIIFINITLSNWFSLHWNNKTVCCGVKEARLELCTAALAKHGFSHFLQHRNIFVLVSSLLWWYCRIKLALILQWKIKLFRWDLLAAYPIFTFPIIKFLYTASFYEDTCHSMLPVNYIEFVCFFSWCW